MLCVILNNDILNISKKGDTHMIDYSEIIRHFADKDIKQYTVKQLRILSASTMKKITENNGDYINIPTIEEICQLLQCQPWELLKDWKIDLDPNKSIEALREAHKQAKINGKEA